MNVGNIDSFLVEEKEFYKRLGRAIKLERIGQGLTQTDVAKAANVTFQAIQKYEKAVNFPKEFRARKIVNFFGKDYDQFLKEYNVYTSNA